MPRHASVLLVIASLGWLAAILVAPYGLDFPYHVGSVICHQRPDRSFWLAGRPLPVCGRCTGLYAAAGAGGLLAVIRAALGGGRRRESAKEEGPRRRASMVRNGLLIAAIPTIATLVVEWLGAAQPSSLVRALAAIPLGAAAGWVVTDALREAGVD